MKNFKDLFVWQQSVILATLSYKVTGSFPAEERFGLINQMRRAAISVASNIAEGHMRFTNREFSHFLTIARGSCSELETQAIISKKLGYINGIQYLELTEQIEIVAKMLSSLRSKVLKNGQSVPKEPRS